MNNLNHILTKNECIDIVTKHLKDSKFEFLNYTIKPLSDAVLGYSGEHLRLKCQIQIGSDSKELSFFIKTKQQQLIKIESWDFEFGIFKSESNILQFLQDNNVENAYWFPKLLLFKEPNVIVLEDLAERNYQLGKIELADFDVAHSKVVLESLAELHGFSFNYEYRKKLSNPKYSLLDDFTQFEDILNTKSTEFGQMWVKSGMDSILYLIKNSNFESTYSKSLISQKLTEFEDKYCNGLQPSKTPYSVISHGDLWGNNLMFNYDNDTPSKCCLIDLQVMRYIPFTFDLHFFIYVNTTQEFRKNHMSELLDFYFDALCKVLSRYGLNPDEFITKESYEDVCQLRKKHAAVLSMFYKTFLLMDRVYFSKVMTDPEKGFIDFVFGDRIPHLELQLEEDPKFKTALFAELQDLVDVFMSI